MASGSSGPNSSTVAMFGSLYVLALYNGVTGSRGFTGTAFNSIFTDINLCFYTFCIV